MKFALLLRPAAFAEIERSRDYYASVGHGDAFVDELDVIFEAMQTMPRRFPLVHGRIHRALLRRYPLAVFFRVRDTSEEIVVLRVFPQRGDPSRWPSR